MSTWEGKSLAYYRESLSILHITQNNETPNAHWTNFNNKKMIHSAKHVWSMPQFANHFYDSVNAIFPKNTET